MAGGVDTIIAHIDKGAEEQAAAVLADARRKADGLLAEAREQAAEKERAARSRGEQEARRESQRILAEARIQARRACVKAQEDGVKQAFAQARQMLQSLADSGASDGRSYADILKRLIIESAIAADTAELEVQVRPADRALLSAAMLADSAAEAGRATGRTITLVPGDEPVAASGGAVVRSRDGRVRVDNTFEARIVRFMDAIRTRVARELFAGE
jgi:V/A-type H+/Na+-transporting ATPase subunit E